jgi:energy-coupling factor transporter ATP-binding protein EcfA2
MATLPKVEATAQAIQLPTASSSQSSANRTVQSEIEVIEYVKLHREPNPHLQIKRVVRNSLTGEDVRHATVEFWLEGKDSSNTSRRLWDFSLLKESNHRSTEVESEEADEAEEKDITSLKFKYARAVVSGVDQIPENWPARVKRTMNQLSGYRKDGVATIPLARLIGDSPQKVLNFLHYYKPGRLWKDYHSVSWEALDELYNGEDLSISAPVTKHDPRCHFSSPEEAMVKLSVGRYVEQKWEEMMYEELCKGGFDAAFFLLGPTTAIACLRRKDPTIFIDSNAVFDDHMTIIIKFDNEIDNCWDDPLNPSGFETTKRLKGRIVSNQTSVDCDVVVLLEKIPHDICKFARLLQQPPRFIDLSDVYIQVIDKPARDQVESLNDFFDRDRSQHKKWWPMLLAQYGSIAPCSNFLQMVGWTSQGFTKVLRNIIDKMSAAGKPLNQEQLSILSNAPYSRAGFKLIRGPPGCGKTTLIAMLAQLYLGAPGVAVIVLAGSNGSTDRSFESLDQWIRKDQNLDHSLWPLRIHKKHVELAHFLDQLDPRSSQDKMRASKKNVASVLEEDNPSGQRLFYERQQHAEKRKHMSDPESGVAAAVLHVLRNNALPTAPPLKNPASKSMHDYHRNQAERSLGDLSLYRDRLRRGTWTKLDDEKRYQVRKDFSNIARYVIGTKRLIVSTVGNATSTVLQDCIFRDAKDVIVLTDEAGLQTDADLVHILAKLINPERVIDNFGGKNPIAAAILVGDEKQGSPIVKSDTAKANIFGPQLMMSPFVRFSLSGFPMDHLWEQHRMVEILCKLPSARGYEGKLRTSNAALSRRMNFRQREILKALLQANLSKLKYPANKERDYIEDQHLRHWLLNVPGGTTQTDPALRNSRFNIANLNVTINFVKGLIKSNFLPPSEIRILTFYQAQRQRYINRVYDLQQELGLTKGELDDLVHTSDSFQGREATYIILDVVVTQYHGEESLGHAGDERKANVAYTRGRDFLFVVASSTILDLNDDGRNEGRVPFIFESMEGMLRRKAVTLCHSEQSPEDVLTGHFDKMSIKGGRKAGIRKGEIGEQRW